MDLVHGITLLIRELREGAELLVFADLPAPSRARFTHRDDGRIRYRVIRPQG